MKRRKCTLAILLFVLLVAATFVVLNVTSVQVEAQAPDWCNDWYVGCLSNAGGYGPALNGCLSGWMWCAGF